MVVFTARIHFLQHVFNLVGQSCQEALLSHKVQSLPN